MYFSLGIEIYFLPILLIKVIGDSCCLSQTNKTKSDTNFRIII